MTIHEMAENLMWDFMKRAEADEERAHQKWRKFSQASDRILTASYSQASELDADEYDALFRRRIQ